MAAGTRNWLKQRHPIYTLRRTEWERNERRYRGGVHVAAELTRFDWETASTEMFLQSAGASGVEREAQQAVELSVLDPALRLAGRAGEHYAARQTQAVYLNFAEAFLTMLSGHLFRKRPTADGGALNFGSLGEVRRDRAGDAPTNAELLFYNVDGVGNDGSQWDAFWADVTAWSGVTGHRWLFAEATTLPGVTLKDVQEGKRPYLVHHSPLEVLNWDYVDGRLAWALIQLPPRSAALNAKGELEREVMGPVRLYVRTGFLGLADDVLNFATGGWWTFDAKGELLTDVGSTGTWDKTKGEIPLWPHFYQRDKDYMSRAAVAEIGNAAVAYMNIDSAATYDAWDAASSLRFLLGVDPDAFKIAMDKVREGSQFIPIPMVQTDPMSGGSGSAIMPSVQDSSAGAVPSTVFSTRMDSIRSSVREITGMEVSGVPDASGLSKIAGFAETKSPRLGLLASEVETSQNIALLFLERRFGSATVSASVQWTRDFELAPVLDSIERLFALEESSGISSPTLGAKAMTTAAKEAGFLTDDTEAATVTAEYVASAKVMQTSRAQQTGLLHSDFAPTGTLDAATSALMPDGVTPIPAVDATSGVLPTDQTLQTTTATVLNGAQIASALAIVTGVAAGDLPRDAGVAMIEILFNLSTDQAERMLGTAGTKAFVKSAPPTAPVPAAAVAAAGTGA